MAHIEFLDETMRDGQQSLWGMRMQAGMALPVSPLIDRTGYRVIDLTGSSMFECLIRYCHENPWEGLDLPVAKDKVAGRIPSLSGEGLDFHRIESVERDALLLAPAKCLFDNHPTIRQSIATTTRIGNSKHDKRQPRSEHVEVDR